MGNTKKCTKCGKELLLDQFYKRRLSTGTICLQAYCKDCSRAYKVRWWKDNPEYSKEWRNNNIDKCRAAGVKWYQTNRDKKQAENAKWRKANRGYLANYKRERRNANPNLRLIDNIRRGIRHALRHNGKTGHSIGFISCSIEELREHLERLFTPGMTWEKYLNGEIHIDHIIPLSYFDFSDPEQQKRAWHYTNLQPLWAIDNLKKGNKIEERQMILL